MKPLTQVLKEYGAKSRDAEYAGYSPLQCAAYDGNLDDVGTLLLHYKMSGTLVAELSRISPAGNTKENILHIAMRHPQTFARICQILERHAPDLFARFIAEGDCDGDTPFHQIAEFGRGESLAILMDFAQKLGLVDEVQKNLLIKNRDNETAAEIAAKGPDSTTVTRLRAASVLTQANLDEALKNRDAIQGIFAGISTSTPGIAARNS